MSSFNYAESVNSNLICCVCRMPFIEPTATTTCSHTFCRECITQAISVVPQCPVDRSPLTENDLCPAASIVRNLVDELIVECPQRSLGCTHACQRLLLATHLKEGCQFVGVECCEEHCEEVLLRKDAKKHSDTCERRIVRCDACGSRMQVVDLRTHHESCPAEDTACPYCSTVVFRGDMSPHTSVCPDFVVKCEHATYGCPWTGPRHKLSSHILRCSYEAIKGFFALNASRISALETENFSLRGRIETLETILRSTKRDVQAASIALGPWFRPDGSHIPPRPSPPSEPAPRTYTRRRLSNALNSAMFGFSPDSTPPTDPTTTHATIQSRPSSSSPPLDAYASFFPPPENSSSQIPHPSDLMLGAGALADGTYPRTTPCTPVAPLNLNTTLEGSLVSLRSSIVTLAASLDSENRRHDIALTTETLRVNEEVMALRAIVHGLRMQVHQIMMDRNSQVTGREDEDGFPRGINSVEPWTSSVRYYNYHPPLNRPITIGTTTHIQTTKL